MTNATHRNLANPPRSRLLKMSANTVMTSQIQMKNKVNQTIDQSTWPTPHSAANTFSPSVVASRCELRSHEDAPPADAGHHLRRVMSGALDRPQPPATTTRHG